MKNLFRSKNFVQKCGPSYKNGVNAQLNEFGNGSEPRERNNHIGGSGKSGVTYGYSGGAGYKTNAPNSTENYPKCFQDGLQGGYYSR